MKKCNCPYCKSELSLSIDGEDLLVNKSEKSVELKHLEKIKKEIENKISNSDIDVPIDPVDSKSEKGFFNNLARILAD